MWLRYGTIVFYHINNSFSLELQLEKLLLDAGPINLFKFVVNPHSFAQSVENIFYLSFLIRDAKVALETNDDGEPVICEFVSISACYSYQHTFSQTYVTLPLTRTTQMGV
jgi:hypothetical protein